MNQVIQHLSGSANAGEALAGGSAEAGEPSEAEAAAEDGGTNINYTVNLMEGVWFLQSWQNGEQTAMAALPDPSAGDGFYQVVIQDGIAYAWAGGACEAVPCAEHIMENASEGAASTNVPGIAARPTKLPGMGTAGEGGGGDEPDGALQEPDQQNMTLRL